MDDGMPLSDQAQVAATHYLNLRRQRDDDEDASWTDVDVPVYPVKPSGHGTASEFRLMLASRLTGGDRSDLSYRWTTNKCHITIEKLLADHGFRFIEVDTGDYA